MAGPITGITGAVTSWGTSSIHSQLAGTGTKPAQFTLSQDADNFDTTGFSDAGIGAHLKGLPSYFFEATAQLVAPAHGAAGLVTYAAGYTANLNSWSLDITRGEFDVTAFGGTSKAWLPGVMNWAGEFSGFLDDTTAAVLVANSSEPATGTFKYQEEGATDNQLVGSIFTTGSSIGVQSNAPNSISYRFQGTGALTHSTPSAGAPVLPTGAVVLTAAEALVLTASTGRTFSASAFWTSINIQCRVGALVTVRYRGRITGALTVA